MQSEPKSTCRKAAQFNQTVQATATAPVSSMSLRKHNTVVAAAIAAANGCA
ncbi:MAG: hypothetical protein ACTHLW_16805 [Verrucomicrobiota bacterium]